MGQDDTQSQPSESKQQDAPATEETKPVEEKQPASNPDETNPPEKVQEDVPAEDVASLEALTDKRFAQELVDLYKAGPGVAHEKKQDVTSEPLDDRSKRGQVHQEIRRIFKSRIETNTSDAGAIIASFVPPRTKSNKKRNRDRRDKRADEPTGDYLHFTLYKQNRDTMDAVNQISRFLKAKPQSIAYAGTKDRRASTAQRCSVRHTRSRALAGINGKLWGIFTGDYEYRDSAIYLGQLQGNEFVITIKNCEIVGDSGDSSAAEKVDKLKKSLDPAMAHMAKHGWINYFGHQRFGTHDVGTHEIGRLILSEQYEEAVKAILHYDEEIASKAETGEVPDEPSKKDEFARNQACMLFLTGKDVDKAIKIMPRRFSAENSIFRHLNRQGAQSRRDFVGALIHITRGLRSMYLHAYQSYMWNHAASRRWETHGETVVEGDLVIAPTETTPLVSGQDQDGDDIINPVEDDEDAPVRARPLSTEEAASGNYTVYDVVLPTPGYDVILPSNDLGTFYEEFMGRSENGGLDPHKMRRMRREFSLPGRYRKLMNRFLAEPSVEVRAYADDTEQMHPTDLDLIESAKGVQRKRTRDDAGDEQTAKRAKVEESSAVSAEVDMTQAQAPKEDAPKEDTLKEETTATSAETTAVQEANKVAVVVKFQLGRSAYATVALRELMGDPPEETS